MQWSTTTQVRKTPNTTRHTATMSISIYWQSLCQAQLVTDNFRSFLLRLSRMSSADSQLRYLASLLRTIAQGDLASLKAALASDGSAQHIECGVHLLHYATIMNRPDMVEALIDSGVDVNERDLAGRTALHIAYLASSDPETIARALLRLGVNPHARDNVGLKALDIAVTLESGMAAVEVLLEHGASCGHAAQERLARRATVGSRPEK
jgi:hypothetical protein